MQKEVPCEERQELEQAVVLAVQAVYSAKRLDAARKAERKALREHIEEHGCKAQKIVL
jgi:hypothetical protein